jgi:Mlc titration factor MtfA (ptsG expression regulator)
MGLSFAWLRRLLGLPVRLAIPDALWRDALRQVRWARALDAPAQARLLEFTERFLAEKAVTGAHGQALSDGQRVLVALLCCRPVLGLDFRWLDGWREVIVYPGAFRAPGAEVDADGVHHSGETGAIGQAWSHGPLLLSWADVRETLERPRPGHDVVVHEVAHKLDALDGHMNGAPPMASGDLATWAREFQAAFDAMRSDLEAGRRAPIDTYAAQSPQEFFAVCSEYWFTARGELRDAMPAVAELLGRFYGKV